MDWFDARHHEDSQRGVGRNPTLIPGNRGSQKGRSGRPPSAIRDLCARSFGERVEFLRAVIDGETGLFLTDKDGRAILDGENKPVRLGADMADRLKAMDLLGKYGGLQKVETESHGSTLEQLLREAENSDGDGQVAA